MLSNAQPKETSLEEENALGFSIFAYLTLVERLFPGILIQLSIGNGNPPEAAAEHQHYTTHDRLFHLPFGVAKTKASPLTEFTSYCQKIDENLTKSTYKPIFKNLLKAIDSVTPKLELKTIQHVTTLQAEVVTQLLTEPYIQKLKAFLEKTTPNQATAERTEKAIYRAIFFRALSYLFKQTTSPKQTDVLSRKTGSFIKKTKAIKNKQTFLMQIYATECDTAEDILAVMLADTEKRMVAQLQTDNLVNIFEGNVKTSNTLSEENTESSDDSLGSIRTSLESSIESVESYLKSIAPNETNTEANEAPKLNFNHFSNHLRFLPSQIERTKSRYEYIINPPLAMRLFLNHYIAIANYFKKYDLDLMSKEIKLATTATICFIQSNLAEIKNNTENAITALFTIKTFKKINTHEERKRLTELQESIQAALKKTSKHSPHEGTRPTLAKKPTITKLGVFKPLAPQTQTPPSKPVKSSLTT